MVMSKMKRKELDEVNDDFSGFSLSAPATKIRRLDAELPPIMEEDELPTFQQSAIPPQQNVALPDELLCENEERAIVLFKPMNNTPLSSFPASYSVSSDILLGLKNTDLWSGRGNLLKSSTDEPEEQDKVPDISNQCLAVVPWVQSRVPQVQRTEIQELDAPEMMEAEENEVSSMEIESEYAGVEQGPGSEPGVTIGSEGLNQWQQQHCMVPQLPQNAASPVVWFQ